MGCNQFVNTRFTTTKQKFWLLITGEIKKKDMTDRKKRMRFNQELRMCFRETSDISPKERKLPTAEPQIITKKLEELKLRWEKNIPAKATKAITNLMTHARKGCLRYANIFSGL